MVVYVEYALVENFLLDGSLLYLSLKFCRLRVRRIALFLSALTGSVFAVLFPLLPLTGVVAYLVRFAFGCVLCFVVSPARSVKKTGIFTAVFYLLTFSLGGALLAGYSFFGISYTESGGYLFSQTPFGVVLGGLVVFFIAAGKIGKYFFSRARAAKVSRRCRLCSSVGALEGEGLADTGNLVTFRGEPVCLVDERAAKPLTERLLSEGTVLVRTALKEGELKIFRGKMEIYSEKGKNIIDKIYFAPAPLGGGEGYAFILPAEIVGEDRDVGRDRP